MYLIAEKTCAVIYCFRDYTDNLFTTNREYEMAKICPEAELAKVKALGDTLDWK